MNGQSYNEVKQTIENNIVQNKEGKITGQILQDTLIDMLDFSEDKQDKLISGVNIKTINGESILEGGDIEVATQTDIEEALKNKQTTLNASVDGGILIQEDIPGVLDTISVDFEKVQSKIEDLDEIRNGAEAGATAVRPEELEDVKEDVLCLKIRDYMYTENVPQSENYRVIITPKAENDRDTRYEIVSLNAKGLPSDVDYITIDDRGVKGSFGDIISGTEANLRLNQTGGDLSKAAELYYGYDRIDFLSKSFVQYCKVIRIDDFVDEVPTKDPDSNNTYSWSKSSGNGRLSIRIPSILSAYDDIYIPGGSVQISYRLCNVSQENSVLSLRKGSAVNLFMEGFNNIEGRTFSNYSQCLAYLQEQEFEIIFKLTTPITTSLEEFGLTITTDRFERKANETAWIEFSTPQINAGCAELAYLTEDEYIYSKDQIDEKFYTKSETDASFVTKEENAWEAGEDTGSAKLKNSRGTVTSKYSVSEGSATLAGAKAYRFTNEGTVTDNLSFATVEGWEVGDVVSIINDKPYRNCSTITSISDSGLVTFDSLPFDEVSDYSGYDAKCAYVEAKPEIGDYDLGVSSHAEGYRTKAMNADTHAEGGQTVAFGIASHTEGEYTVASNAAEHAEGRYNKSNNGTRHSVGIGAADDDRANAFEIMANGDAYLFGVGGYDGTNPLESGVKKLQDILSNLPEIININFDVEGGLGGYDIPLTAEQKDKIMISNKCNLNISANITDTYDEQEFSDNITVNRFCDYFVSAEGYQTGDTAIGFFVGNEGITNDFQGSEGYIHASISITQTPQDEWVIRLNVAYI